MVQHHSSRRRRPAPKTRNAPRDSTMTMAGDSAGAEARRQRSRAQELRRQAHDAEQLAARFEIAERTESETARILAPLAGIGYHLLADRRWSGSGTAQVDMVVVGRAGVVIVDTKTWRGRGPRRPDHPRPRGRHRRHRPPRRPRVQHRGSIGGHGPGAR
ncbi:hypothetical protein CURTO8I2_130083 [Curtobacterium sp. 8I-2]|nr:hypothetical protein CURTO8I2_130083 [Curtobacterium sp. 8I-2]